MRMKIIVVITVMSVMLPVQSDREKMVLSAEILSNPTVETSGNQEASDRGPVIEVEKAIYDLGQVSPERTFNCEFHFRNAGDSVLKIENVLSNCSCTVGKMNGSSFLPGENGFVEVQFHSPPAPGVSTQNLYIISNDKNTPRYRLTIKAQVELSVTVKPSKLSLSLNAKDADLEPILIKSKNNELFSIRRCKSTNNAIVLEYDPNIKAKEFVLQPKAMIEILDKHPYGKIIIDLENANSERIYVDYTALPVYTISPQMLIVQNGESGKHIKKSISITNNYSDQYKIESISSIQQYIRVVEQQRCGNKTTLELQVIPPTKTAESACFTDELRIKTDDGHVLNVRCAGWFK